MRSATKNVLTFVNTCHLIVLKQEYSIKSPDFQLLPMKIDQRKSDSEWSLYRRWMKKRSQV